MSTRAVWLGETGANMLSRLGCSRELRSCPQDRYVACLNPLDAASRDCPLRVANRKMHRSRKILRGFRRHQRRQLPEMRRQGSQACEEEEDQARDQDPAELGWRPQRCCTA